MSTRPQEFHADLGLVENDNTEDMRKPPAIDTVLQHRAAEGLPNYPIHQKGKFMMTVTPNALPALPAGADIANSDEWQPAEDGTPEYRCVWTPHLEDDIRGVVIQYADGSVASEGGDAPLVYIGGSDYHPDDARVIAMAILRAADQVDAWAGRRSSDG